MLAEFGVYIAKGLVRAISFSQGVLAGWLTLPTIDLESSFNGNRNQSL
jgi:hypothetical protein